MTSRRKRSRVQAAQPAQATQPAAPEPQFVPTADTPRLHYRGDRRNFDPRRVYGPDAFRAHYRAGAAEYDAGADRTTLYFKPVVPAKTEVAA